MEITPIFPIAGQILSLSFEVYLKFVTVFQNIYAFILQFLAKPLTMFCGTLGFRETLF